MFNGNGGFSLADIAAACRGNGNGNDGFGNNGWWVIIILLALWGGNDGLFGRGNNNGNGSGNGNCCSSSAPVYVPVPMGGYGMYGGMGYGFSEAAVQRGFDNQGIMSAINGVSNGICSLGYDQLAQFNGVNNNVMQTGFGLQQTAQQGQIANMQAFNALSSQLSGCCCDNKAMIADLKYDMATSDCSIKTLINQVTQQLMWGQQNGLRDLMDLINQKFCQLENSQKDNVIADLRAQLTTCGNNAALQALYNQFVAFYNQKHPEPVPCYPGANPNGMGNWGPSVLAQAGGCDCFGNPCCR